MDLSAMEIGFAKLEKMFKKHKDVNNNELKKNE
jgi:hypothetical protein